MRESWTVTGTDTRGGAYTGEKNGVHSHTFYSSEHIQDANRVCSAVPLGALTPRPQLSCSRQSTG